MPGPSNEVSERAACAADTDTAERAVTNLPRRDRTSRSVNLISLSRVWVLTALGRVSVRPRASDIRGSLVLTRHLRRKAGFCGRRTTHAWTLAGGHEKARGSCTSGIKLTENRTVSGTSDMRKGNDEEFHRCKRNLSPDSGGSHKPVSRSHL